MAIRFDNVNDQLQSLNPPSTAYTVMVWMLRSVDLSPTSETIFSLTNSTTVINDGSDTHRHLYQTEVNGTHIQVGVGDSVQSLIDNPTIQGIGEWWCNAIVIDATATTLYQKKDGDASLVKTNTATTAETGFTPGELLLGSDGHFNEMLNGRLRGFKIWNGVRLTDTELATEATQLAPVRRSNLWAYYKFKDVATMLLDTSGNGRNLTNPSGAGAWTEEADPSIPESLASAIKFPYVNMPTGNPEPLDANSDRLLVRTILPQGSIPTAVNFTAGIQRDSASSLQLQDITRIVSLSAIAVAGSPGNPGNTGVTGLARTLQNLYDADLSSQIDINLSPTLGAVYITEPSGGVSGNILFRIQNGVTGAPTNYFQVTPTGIFTSGQLSGKRIDLNGTPLVQANFSLGRLGSGNGQTNSMYGVTNISGDDSHAKFTVVVSATGYTLNPIITLNFPSLAGANARRANAPFIVSKLTAPMSPTSSSSTGGPTGMGYESSLIETTISPTNIQWMLRAAPTAGSYFTITFVAIS